MDKDEKWDDITTKKSHENKTLAKHIEEVKELLPTFLDFYSFPKEFYKIGEYIAEYHDHGKLSKKWNIENKERPPHSTLSLEWIKQHKKFYEDEKFSDLLSYLILKHHSTLTTRIIGDDYLEWKIKNRLKNLSWNDVINLVDLFGLFKLADICSAENNFLSLKTPSVSEEDVKAIFSQQIDLRRWNEQLMLRNLPEISLLRAYTGWGKTDASLLFFKNKSVSKIIYLFPTITAINKFYKKLKEVKKSVTKYFYFYDTEVNEDLDLFQTMIFKENFTDPYIITTVDQFLLSFLQVGKYYRKRVMFRNSGIVVDEVHLLNPLMLYLFTYFLKKYMEIYKFKILFMSATLPNSIIDYLNEELNLSKNSFLDFSSGYKWKRRVQFEFYNKDIESSVEEIINKFKEGKKVLVVVNTVEKSISIAQKLKSVGEENVILIHARFMYRDRLKKEKDIDELNKPNKPHILITTQVCEVSLDISYDFLFTELAPISSLIQRFGRVNRHGENTEKTNVKIFRPDIRDERHYPYSKNELETAEKIVKELEGDNLKAEIELLDKLNEINTYEEFQKELEKERKEINLYEFERLLQFFFSLDISEEDVLKVLDYRDSFTTLVIPAPENIEDERLKNEIESLIKEEFKNKSFNERKQLISKFKEVSVPVPFWWIKERIENKAIPIVDLKNKIYNSFYGFVEIKGEII